MRKFYNIQRNRLNSILKKNTTLTNMLLNLFDFGSMITHFFLFNFVGYVSFISFLFFVPVFYSNEFTLFLMTIWDQPVNIGPCFFNLPLALQLVMFCYVIFIDLVFLCTFLASIPVVKDKMIERYNDPLILKKRGYNMLGSSVRRATILGLPLAAAAIVAGDSFQHHVSVEAIMLSNERVWEEYKRTSKKILDRLQKRPTGGFREKIQELSVKSFNTLMSWKNGSRAQD